MIVRIKDRGDASHWRWDGEPKVGYSTMGRAVEALDWMKNRWGGVWAAYGCRECSRYHVGNVSRKRQMIHYRQRYAAEVADEVGDRVLGNLRKENIGKGESRMATIEKRWRRAVRNAMLREDEQPSGRYYRRVRKGFLP